MVLSFKELKQRTFVQCTHSYLIVSTVEEVIPETLCDSGERQELLKFPFFLKKDPATNVKGMQASDVSYL